MRLSKDLIKFEDGGIVVFATLLVSAVDGSGQPIQSEKSTAILNALSYVKTRWKFSINSC